MKDILCKGVGKEGWGGQGGGVEAPPDFKVMLLCVQVVTAKGHPKCIMEKKPRGKSSFQVVSSVTHTKSKLRNVLIYELRLSLHATNSILEAKPPPPSQKLSTPLPCHVKTELGVKVYPSCSLLELLKVTEICGQETTLFCTDCCSLYCESCSNLCHKNPRRKGHSLKPITETDPKTQDPP